MTDYARQRPFYHSQTVLSRYGRNLRQTAKVIRYYKHSELSPFVEMLSSLVMESSDHNSHNDAQRNLIQCLGAEINTKLPVSDTCSHSSAICVPHINNHESTHEVEHNHNIQIMSDLNPESAQRLNSRWPL